MRIWRNDVLRRRALPAVSLAATALAGIMLLSAALAPNTAAAQTTGGSVAIAVSGNNGDRNPNADGLQVNEGDRITFTITTTGATNDHPYPSITLAAGGTAWNSDDLTPAGTGGLSGFQSSIAVALSGSTETYSYAVNAGDGWAHGECRETVTLRIHSAGSDSWFAIGSAGAATVEIVPDTVGFCGTSAPDLSWQVGQAIASAQLPMGGGLDASTQAVNSLGFATYGSDYHWDERNVRYRIAPALPRGITWGVLSPQRLELRGTPTVAMSATQYTWQITDRLGNVARLRFSITITDPAPNAEALAAPALAFSTAPADQVWTQGKPIARFNLPTASGGSGAIRYTLSPTLPGGVVRDTASHRISGTPAIALSATAYTWTAADENGNSTSATFRVTVKSWPGPVFASLVGEKTWAQNSAITAFSLPTATGGQGSITYALSPDLPNGVVRDTASHRISGTPTAMQSRALYTWTATDGDGNQATRQFYITVVEQGSLIATPGWSTARGITTEAGGAVTFTVRLATEPQPYAIVSFASNDSTEGTVSPAQITLHETSSNDVAINSGLWNNPYTVTVTGVDDADADGDVDYTVTATASCDALTPNCGYASAGAVTLRLTNADDDRAATAETPAPAANSAPSITNPGDKSYAQGERIAAFGITVADAEDTPTVWVDGLPFGLSYNAALGQVGGTVGARTAVGDYTATITANDGVNPDVTATFTITVTATGEQPVAQPEPPPANSAPVITNPGDKSYRQGDAITAFDITVTDADAGDTVTVSVSGLPAGLAYSASTGQVSGTVDSAAVVKDYTATITANDGVNEAVTDTFTVSVAAAESTSVLPDVATPSNSAPVITNPGDKSYRQGDAITAFDITVTDADAGDTVTVSVSGLPAGLAYSASTGQVSGTVDSAAVVKDYTATITANDGVNDPVTDTFTVSVAAAESTGVLPRVVTPGNSPPVITNPGNKLYTKGRAITAFDITVTDADAGDTVTVSVSGLPGGLAYSASTGQVSGTVAANAVAKDYTVTITANDGVNDPVADTFTVSVAAESVILPPGDGTLGPPRLEAPANSPPVITNPGDQSYRQGDAITAFDITVSDADAGDTVTVSVSGLPSGLAYSASAGQVGGTVDSAAVVKDYMATITASDGVNDPVTDTFTVTVGQFVGTLLLNRRVTNNPPVITNPGDKSYTQGDAVIAFGITVTDADAGDTVTVSVSGLPAGLAYSASAGQVGGAVDSAAVVKDYTATITASDGVNDPVTDTFTVTVRQFVGTQVLNRRVTNNPPVITYPGDKSYVQGDVIYPFAIIVMDDEDVPAVAVSGLPLGLLYSRITGRVSGTVATTATVQEYRATITADDGVNAVVSATFRVRVLSPDDDDDDDDRRVVVVEETEPTAEPAPTETPPIRPPVWHANPGGADRSGSGGGSDSGGGLASFLAAAGAPTPTPPAGARIGTPEPTAVAAGTAAAPSAAVDAPLPTPRVMTDAPPEAPAMPGVAPQFEPNGIDDGAIQLALRWSWWLLLLLALLAVLVAVVYFSGREKRYYLD